MATNKFATMLHKNTNKLTLILVYTLLEWTLILLLLLNSLLSYLIIKFANYFGLKPPCFWCSHINHIDLLCQTHAYEISELGYCSTHHKLGTYRFMCENCKNFNGVSKNFTLMVKENGMLQNNQENVDCKCSCCNASLEEKQVCFPSYAVIPKYWDEMENAHQENLEKDGLIDHHVEKEGYLDRNESEFMIDHLNDNQNAGYELIEGEAEDDDNDGDSSVFVSKFELIGLEEIHKDDELELLLERDGDVINEEKSSLIMEDLIADESLVQVFSKKEESCKIHPHLLEFFIDFSGQQLVPFELVDSLDEEIGFGYVVEDNQKINDQQESSLGSEFGTILGEETKFALFESMEMEETENSLVFHPKECYSVQVATNEATQTPLVDIYDFHDIVALEREEKESHFPLVYNELYQLQINESEPEVLVDTATAALDAEERESDVHTVDEEVTRITINETKTEEVSIGTVIPDLNSTEETQENDIVCLHEEHSTSSINFLDNLEHVSQRKLQEDTDEFKNLSVEVHDHTISNHLFVSTDQNGIEEEKIPDTPTSSDSFHHLLTKLLLLDRKETEEESLDDVISEFDAVDGIMTVEHLTSALKAERKALHFIYAELEEERSASAVAANQTMAMINRLQEEKAAMQMEALQYQRMMEEQSEYDQEALQLMNELMVKREREKQELEKELEIYRKKVMDYDAKEKMRMLRRSKSGSVRSEFSSASFSNEEDSDEISVDLNHEIKDQEDGFYSHEEDGLHNTPVDEVLNLGDSFGEFEEERMTILEQLKVLEDKLFLLSEEEQHFGNARPIQSLYQANGKHSDDTSELVGEEINGMGNAYHKKMNGKHQQEGKLVGAKAKNLLHLFDAEDENVLMNGHETGVDAVVKRFKLEERRVAIKEEVDTLYARMHALETDKEFLKHCSSSLNKGDKGVDILQEILQNLRDLRNVELRVRSSFKDGTLVSDSLGNHIREDKRLSS